MKTSIIASLLVSATALAVYAYPTTDTSRALAPEPASSPSPSIKPVIQKPSVIVPITQSTSKKIEVAFVLDTTGSMSGLIQGAKDNIWSIASSMASAQSAPTIEMGLVAYRDRGDEYVTKVVDLSDDLDTSYGTLMDFQADGGGDHPESVNKALFDAVTGMSWSNDDDTYRVIFLVGDAPPQNRYQDEMQFPEIVKLAKSKGIIINTIQCGQHQGTAAAWRQIAKLSAGDFFQVEQSGSAVAVVSPYDKKIAMLSKELDETRLFFGNEKVKETKRRKTEATKRFNSSASAPSIARKAEFNLSKSGSRNFADDNELVDAITSGRVELDKIAEQELPKELQKLDRAEQEIVVQKKAKKRQKLRLQLSELGKQRSDYVKAELSKSGAGKDSIDNKIYQAVKSQASKKGLVYSEDAPKY